MMLADIFTNHFLTVTRNELVPVPLNGRDKTSSFGKKIRMALENAVKNPIKSLPPRVPLSFSSGCVPLKKKCSGTCGKI